MQENTPRACVFEKSTNGRIDNPAPRWLRKGLRALAATWPGGAQRLAIYLFCHPHRKPVRPGEAAVLGEGRSFRIATDAGPLRAWSWGRGPAVVLHHGWSGHAGHMTAFVVPLVAAGLRAVAYDAPAHGASPGRITSGPDLARTLQKVVAEVGDVRGVVAHSMGCFATMLAIGRGLDVPRAVLLAPPAGMRRYFACFGEHLGLSARDRSGMRRRTEEMFGFRWEEMSVESWTRDGRPPLLVVHDEGDPVVPVASARRIVDVWGCAELVVTRGLGHGGVRRDPAVIARAVEFVGQGAAAAVETA